MIRVEKRPRRGEYAVYEDDRLLAVTAYKKGALAVQARLGQLLDRVAALEAQLGADDPPPSRRPARSERDTIADECDGYCLILEEHFERCIYPAWLARVRARGDEPAGAPLVQDGKRSADERPRAAEAPADREVCAAVRAGKHEKEANA